MFKETGGFSKKGNLRSNKVYIYIIKLYIYIVHIYIQYICMIESITVSSESSHKPFSRRIQHGGMHINFDLVTNDMIL
jgi:uncharacterized membrane protein